MATLGVAAASLRSDLATRSRQARANANLQLRCPIHPLICHDEHGYFKRFLGIRLAPLAGRLVPGLARVAAVHSPAESRHRRDWAAALVLAVLRRGAAADVSYARRRQSNHVSRVFLPRHAGA